MLSLKIAVTGIVVWLLCGMACGVAESERAEDVISIIGGVAFMISVAGFLAWVWI